MLKPLISVIVPVYNVEIYLHKCLDSLINQTYENIEIILVDDGSTDNSSKICDEYVERFGNIKCFHKSNGGLSDARNYGVQRATGEYIGFLDSDDYIEKDMYKELITGMLSNGCLLGECGVKCIFKNEVIVNESKKAYVINSSELLLRYFQKKEINKIPRTAVWSKLFHRSILVGKEFPVGQIHEDYLLTVQCITEANTIFIVEKPLYNHIYTNPTSITSSTFNKRDLYREIQHKKVFEYLDQYGLHSLAKLAERDYCKVCLQFYYRCFFSKFEEYKKYKTILKDNKRSIRKLHFCLNDKIQFEVFFLSPKLFLMMRYFKKNI